MIRPFHDEWKALLSAPGSGKKEVEGELPLRLIYGANERGQALFFAISDSKPGLPELSRAVQVERGVRTIDGKWTLSLTLDDSRFVDVFMRLAEDLVRRASRASSEAQALAYLLVGIDEWKHLLRNQFDDRLQIDAIRGLVAELWFGFCFLTAARPADEILEAWTGPLGSAQDFNFSSGQTFEVKSAHPDSKSITISSAAQLDVGDRPLSLIVVTLVQVAATNGDALSLKSLVTHAERLLSPGTAAIDLLQDRLEALRVDVNDEYYDKFWFVVSGSREFVVGQDFPAIRGSQLSAGIEKVSYSLKLGALSGFEAVRT